MIKWEYLKIQHHLTDEDLNQLGQEGWELFDMPGLNYFFKRPTNFMELQNELREAWVEAIKGTFAELFNEDDL